MKRDGAYVRVRDAGTTRDYGRQRPTAIPNGLVEGHPCVGTFCAACDELFEVGDRVALIALGPGDDEEARARALAGLSYSSATAIVHAACGNAVMPDEEPGDDPTR